MQGVADNAINSAVIGGGFGAPMGVVDTLNHRMAVGKQKKELLKMVHTGNAAIDEQLKNYVEMVNQTATDLADLVSTSRINALNAMGRKEARAKELMQSTESAVGFGGDFVTDEPVQTEQSIGGSVFDLGKSAVSSPDTSSLEAETFSDLPLADSQNEAGYDDSPRFSRSAMKSVEANIKRGREAMSNAILNKATVHRAMYRNDLDGWVDFEWGDTGRTLPSGKTKGAMGLSHILDKRMSIDGMTEQEAVSFLIDDITETIAKGSTVRETNFEKTKTVQIVYNGNEVKLAKKQGNNGWVITGFKQFQPMNQSRGATTSDLRNSDPIRSRIEMGATGLNQTIPLNDQTVNVDDSERNRYSFAGENAKTADHSLLAKAKSAVENGADPEIVRQQTGWFKGKDDKWRFEIDDSEVRFLDKDIEIGADLFYLLGSRIHKLRHVIQADALFSAYPELKDVGIKASNLEGNNSGYSRSQNLIYLDRNLSGEQAKSIWGCIRLASMLVYKNEDNQL